MFLISCNFVCENVPTNKLALSLGLALIPDPGLRNPGSTSHWYLQSYSRSRRLTASDRSVALNGTIHMERKNVHWLWMEPPETVPPSGTQSGGFVNSSVRDKDVEGPNDHALPYNPSTRPPLWCLGSQCTGLKHCSSRWILRFFASSRKSVSHNKLITHVLSAYMPKYYIRRNYIK